MLKLEEIATILNTAGLGVFAPGNNATNTIFLGRMGLNKDKKNETVTIYAQENSTDQPESVGKLSSYENEAFEIIVTWNESYDASETRAFAIRDLFLGRTFTLSDSTIILNIDVGKPVHLGINTNNNAHGFKITFVATKTTV